MSKDEQWMQLINQRDEEGNLTPLALALDAIADNGCDCPEDTPGTCLACRCELALKALWNALHEVKAHFAGLPSREELVNILEANSMKDHWPHCRRHPTQSLDQLNGEDVLTCSICEFQGLPPDMEWENGEPYLEGRRKAFPVYQPPCAPVVKSHDQQERVKRVVAPEKKVQFPGKGPEKR